jgi:hypothetical protein
MLTSILRHPSKTKDYAKKASSQITEILNA